MTSHSLRLGIAALACLVLSGAAVRASEPEQAYIKWLAEYPGWVPVSDYYPSATHWEQDIRTYVRADSLVSLFEHNYAMEQLELEGADMEEIEDEGGFRMYPIGTLLAKENFRKGEDGGRVLDTVSFMFKRAPGKWRYVHLGADGSVQLDSDADSTRAEQECAVCHAEVDYRDFIYHTFFDEKTEAAKE